MIITFYFLLLISILELFTPNTFLCLYGFVSLYLFISFYLPQKNYTAGMNIKFNVQTDFLFYSFILKSIFSYILPFIRFFFYQLVSLKWKPLFKKSSYYGLYRANKNQWLNK